MNMQSKLLNKGVENISPKQGPLNSTKSSIISTTHLLRSATPIRSQTPGDQRMRKKIISINTGGLGIDMLSLEDKSLN